MLLSLLREAALFHGDQRVAFFFSVGPPCLLQPSKLNRLPFFFFAKDSICSPRHSFRVPLFLLLKVFSVIGFFPIWASPFLVPRDLPFFVYFFFGSLVGLFLVAFLLQRMHSFLSRFAFFVASSPLYFSGGVDIRLLSVRRTFLFPDHLPFFLCRPVSPFLSYPVFF